VFRIARNGAFIHPLFFWADKPSDTEHGKSQDDAVTEKQREVS